ncbi:MAG: aminodeoxychorismate synthase component I [Candidatus Competibacter sp.]|nr:aminodeoxychorismate synthase component I [Candidatus Competibacter sp.]MDG4584917.1 aminodeoxychorismate synthase component I [Candidatus Competibacter sp.]
MVGDAFIQDGRRGLRFAAPAQIVVAMRPDEIVPALQAVETAVDRQGLTAAGFIAYEAAAAYGLAVHAPLPDLPLLWFGLYERVAILDDWVAELADPPSSASYTVGSWQPAFDRATHATVVRRIKDYLARGHSYQVNHTFPLQAAFAGDPWPFFVDLATAQQGEHAAYIDTGRFAVCSASPELFFQLDGERLTTRPMKGTAARGRTLAEDEARMSDLGQSVKNRAENLMIVDMLRNDLGRVAETGSVAVPRLFAVERYPTLLQMTSTVTARTRASVAEVLASLFPCASITGAPKVRTMQIVRELEPQPRGVYTGAIGWIGPERRACFNVAIRTALVDRDLGRASYGVGGGVVWDSDASDEYSECLLKAGVLTARQPRFQLLESLLWEPGDGYFLLEAHLARLADTAVYFNIPLDRSVIKARLRELATPLNAASKIRLLLDRNGAFTMEVVSLTQETSPPPVRIGLAQAPVDSHVIWLYHKTTRREIYDAARASRPDCDEVILWNERGELTEASTANLVLDLDGERLTPPVTSGLLAGTFRGWLLAAGHIREQVLAPADLRAARCVYLINSVRKWRATVFVS